MFETMDDKRSCFIGLFETEGAPQGGESDDELFRGHQRHGEVGVGLHIVRLERQRLPIERDRFGNLALPHQRQTKIVVRIREYQA